VLTTCTRVFRFCLMINGRKAIHEALVFKSIHFADRELAYFDSLTNPHMKGATLVSIISLLYRPIITL